MFALKTLTLQLRFNDGSDWFHNPGPATDKLLAPYFLLNESSYQQILFKFSENVAQYMC